MDALDERVLRDDEPAVELRRVVLDRLRRARGARARASRPSSPSSESFIDDLRSAGSRRGADHGNTGGAGAMHAAAFVASIPPIATTGMSTAAQISRSPSSPIGGSASGFDGVAQTGPAPM